MLCDTAMPSLPGLLHVLEVGQRATRETMFWSCERGGGLVQGCLLTAPPQRIIAWHRILQPDVNARGLL